jgi:hypothetical protein
MRRDLKVAVPLLAVATSACAHSVKPRPDVGRARSSCSRANTSGAGPRAAEAVCALVRPESRRDLRPAIGRTGPRAVHRLQLASDAGVAGQVASRTRRSTTVLPRLLQEPGLPGSRRR